MATENRTSGRGGRAALAGAAILAGLLAAAPAAAVEEAVAVITDIHGAADVVVQRGGARLRQGLLGRLRPGDVVGLEAPEASARIHTSAGEDVVVQGGRAYTVPSAPRLGTVVNVVRLLFGTLDGDRRLQSINAATRGERAGPALPPSVLGGTARIVARPGPVILPLASGTDAPQVRLVTPTGQQRAFARRDAAAYRLDGPPLEPGRHRVELIGAGGRLVQGGTLEVVAPERLPVLPELAPRAALGEAGARLVAAAQLAVAEDGAWLLESLRRLDEQRRTSAAAGVLMRRLEAGAGLRFMADAGAVR